MQLGINSINTSLARHHQVGPDFLGRNVREVPAYDQPSSVVDHRDMYRVVPTRVRDTQASAWEQKTKQLVPNEKVRTPLISARCPTECGCSFHRPSQFRSPKLLDPTISFLFVGYFANPLILRRCDVAECVRRPSRASVAYTFPGWLFRKS